MAQMTADFPVVATASLGAVAAAAAADASAKVAAQHVVDNGTYAPITTTALAAPAIFRPGRKWVFLGDSITNGSNASNFIYSYSRQACHMAGTLNAASDSIEAGTPGDTAAAALARFDAQSVGAEALVILLGTNDTGTAIALATYQANIMAIVAKAKVRGLPVVMCTIPPRTTAVTTAAMRLAISAYNVWIRMWAPSQGCEVAEVYGVLADATTGDLLAAYDGGDGIHPSERAHIEIAQVVSAAMLRAAPNRLGGLVYAVEAANLLTNPLMAGAGTNPTGSSGHTATGTASTNTCPVTDVSGVLPAGKWAQMDLTAGSASVSFRQFGLPASAPTTWELGDKLALTGLVQVEAITGDWEAAVAAGTAQITLQIRNGTSGLTLRSLERCAGRPLTPGGAIYNIGPMLTTLVVDAAMVTGGLVVVYGITLPTGLQVKARFGTFGVFNTTKLGLSTLVGTEVMSNL